MHHFVGISINEDMSGSPFDTLPMVPADDLTFVIPQLLYIRLSRNQAKILMNLRIRPLVLTT